LIPSFSDGHSVVTQVPIHVGHKQVTPRGLGIVAEVHVEVTATPPHFAQIDAEHAPASLLVFGAVPPQPHGPEFTAHGQVRHQRRVDVIDGSSEVVIDRFAVWQLG